MQWGDLMQVVVPALYADNDLSKALHSDGIKPTEDDKQWLEDEMRWSITGESEDDVFNGVLVTFEYRVRTRALAVIVDKRMKRVLDWPTYRMFGGVYMLSKFSDARDIEDAVPGIVRRQIDFRFETEQTRVTD